MGSVWKRLNRINKRAAKFHFTASYSELWLEAGPNWQPTALSVIWTRKSRRVVSEPVKWEPTMKSPYIGMCVWPVPENKDITVTMFRDAHKEEYDNKDWFFILEDVAVNGKRKPVAQGRLNMKDFCTLVPTQSEITVKLRPVSKKVTAAKLSLTLTSELIREGKPSDSDMMSQISGNSTLSEDWRNRLQEVDEEEGVAASISRRGSNSSRRSSISQMVKQSMGLGKHTSKEREEISSITRQIEQLSNSPPLASRPQQLPLKTAEVGRDENENQQQFERKPPAAAARRVEEVARPVVPQPMAPRKRLESSQNSTETQKPPDKKEEFEEKKELDSRPRLTDEKASSKSSFSSREFKSAFNGPRGQYGSLADRALGGPSVPKSDGLKVQKEPETRKLPEVPARVAPTSQTVPLKASEVSPLPKTMPPNHSITQTLASKAEVSQSKGPPEVSKPVVAEQSKSTSSTPSPKPAASPEPKISPARSPLADLPVAETSPKRVSPITSPVAPPVTSPVKSTAASSVRTSPEKSPVTSSSSEVEAATPLPPVLKGTPELEADPVVKKIIVTDEDEEDDEVVEDVGTRTYQRTKSQEFRDYQQEFVLTSTIDFGPLSSPLPSRKTSSASSAPLKRSPTPPEAPIKDVEAHIKTEIAPSNSFLDNLNRNSTLVSTPSTPSSPPTPEKVQNRSFERGNAATATMMRREKVLTDRTNSLLRQNTTSTTEELLEWTKGICANYSNIKVTNFGTSWRNGLAFCALIHSFYPDLIPYSQLSSHDIKDNCKLAFEAAEKLGVSRLIEPSDMVIKRVPDKLLVITYLHQLRSALGKEETRILYEQSKLEATLPSGVKKSFSDGNIRLFSRSGSHDTEPGLETIQEAPSGGDSIKPEKISEYRKRAQTLVKLARSESRELEEKESKEKEVEEKEKENGVENGVESPPRVTMRQRSSTPKTRRDNRLSYIDNEIKVLDAEQLEVDKQLSILERRLRETSEDDTLVYDALLQQFLTLVNRKNALMKRQDQLNMLDKEADLEKKLAMLQEELRALSELEEERKTEEDRKREDLLLEELVECVKKRNELVDQQDEQEKQNAADEALDQEVGNSKLSLPPQTPISLENLGLKLSKISFWK